jgi:hypothetical protein
VKEEQWKTFHERMEAALSQLKGLDPKDDPNVYLDYAQIALDLGSRAAFDKIYASEIRDYPTFFHFYAERAVALQEKWGGEPGDLPRYTRSLLSFPGGQNGQLAYTYVAGRLVTQFSREQIFEKTGLNWPLLKDAYLTRKKQYGWSDADKSVLLSYAIAAQDDAFANDLRARWND